MNTIALRKHVSLAAAASALLMSVSLSAQAQQSDMTVQAAKSSGERYRTRRSMPTSDRMIWRIPERAA